ncbi:MAG: HIT family protein, partial [Ilumatobacteraceae bacterium]
MRNPGRLAARFAPRVAGAAEIIDLSPSDRARLLDEIVAVSTALRDETEPVKLNVAALGNMVRQLHVHIVARFEADPAWPGPVWGRCPARCTPTGAPTVFTTSATIS